MANFGYYKGGTSRILDVQHVETEPDSFDEIRVTVAKVASTLNGGRTYAIGANPSGPTGTFKCASSILRWGTGGEVIQEAVFKGVFGSGKWKTGSDSNIQSFSPTNIKLNVTGYSFPSGTNSATVWARSNIMLVLPVFYVWAVDTTAPNLSQIGDKATSPYAGSFPSPPSNPFSISPAINGTVQYPEGWILTGIPHDSIEGGGVFRKQYIYQYQWNLVP